MGSKSAPAGRPGLEVGGLQDGKRARAVDQRDAHDLPPFELREETRHFIE